MLTSQSDYSPKTSLLRSMGKFVTVFFLTSLFQTAAFAQSAGPKPPLSQADFRYLGAFAMPYQGVGGDPTFGRGLTHRYVNGELHLISVSNNPASLYEVRVPTLSQGTSSLPVAPVVMEWG
jgi:hypothetical protein